MTSPFVIKEHVVEAQHIREYPHATAHSQDEVLYVSVKQYIPKSNPEPQPGDLTIIASHANGFVKELYEPLWEDLVNALAKRGVRVRGIWIADVAWQGQSGVINENVLGNDPAWIDHARDLLCVVNRFRREMPRPLVGMGHSFGGNIIVNLALIHPRLFSALVMLDPVLSFFKLRGPKYGFSPMVQTAVRRDLWPTREAAEASFRRNKFYQSWDPRVLDAWNKYGIRDTPSKLYPESGKATLTTSKHMEVFTYYRPTAQGIDEAGNRVFDKSKLLDADNDTLEHPEFPFYRPEGPVTASRLPTLRPGVLWLFGGKSDVCTPEIREEKMELTGVGVGGSGGEKAGRVKQVVLEEYGHLVPMEATTRCAEFAADFITPELELWRKEDAEFQRWASKPDTAKQTMDDDWKRWIGPVKQNQKL